MRILGVDFGTKRIGLAWADTTLGIVLPYGLVEAEALAAKVSKLAKLIQSDRIDQVVIGFPLGVKGEENKNTERVQKFAFELQKHITQPVAFFDERFTSLGADAMGGGVSRDERAAMLILEGFLQQKKG